MHQIGVVGLSYRHAGVDEVARFAVPRADVAARLPALRERLNAAEILYVGTCNRVEVVYATHDGSPAGDSRPDVFAVLTGRDSAQTGEQEIAAQLRDAWEESRAARTCGPLLDRLIGEALGMARRVQRMTARVRTPSLGDLAAERVLKHLDGAPGATALLGVSPMTRRCAALLSRAHVPLLIVNRTLGTARALAQSLAS